MTTEPKEVIPVSENATLTQADNVVAEKLGETEKPVPAEPGFKPDLRFWLLFLALGVSTFLAALELTAVSTALPSIAADLRSNEYSWIGSAYALTSTALILATGGLSAIFGRQTMMLVSLVLFIIGSAITGAAKNIAMAIGGRAIQGIGGGGILTMTEIVISDIVPLAQRGAYFSFIGAIWAIASAVGPPVGGAFANAGQWRWLFYINIPLGGLAIVLVVLFLRVKQPPLTLKEKLARLDPLNLLFIGAATAAIIGLTFAGDKYPWSSFRVLVPLIIGLVGMVAFVFLEKLVKYPTVPFDVLSHTTSLLGFFMTFVHGIIAIALLFYLPIYFQGVKGDSPVRAGVNIFPLSFTIAPFAMITGISITLTGHYYVQSIIGFALQMIGFGIFTLIEVDTSTAKWAGFSVLLGIGLGILYASSNFAVLAPLKVEQQPAAMAFFTFVRSFGQVLGIAIGATIFNNELQKNLPVGAPLESANYEAILTISDLPEPIRSEIRLAITDSLRVIWQTSIGIAGIGFIAALFVKQMTLASGIDESRAIDQKTATTVPA